MTKSAAALAVTIFAAATLTACGSSDSTATKTATVPTGKLGAKGAGGPASVVGSHFIHYHFNGYQGVSARREPYQCGHSTSTDATGGCFLQQEHVNEKSWPFTSDANLHWKEAGGLCSNAAGNVKPAGTWQRQVRLYTSPRVSPAAELCGWVDWHWGKMAVTWGDFDGKIVRPSGTAGTEQRNGPLFVFLSYNSHPKGYIVGLRGYVEY